MDLLEVRVRQIYRGDIQIVVRMMSRGKRFRTLVKNQEYIECENRDL